MHVSVIIPTYNGLSLLQKHLPTLLIAEGVADTEIVIADDGSADGTADWVRDNVPQARVLRLETNAGFSRACNAAIAQARGEAVLLLNNDVSVDPCFLLPLLRCLESDPDVFAVNSRILIPGQGMLDEGEKRGGFHHGLFYVDCQHDPVQRSRETAPTLYATACAALYRKSMIDRLGGFDELFSPFYWEDVDLSYRALKRGWKVLYEPQSVVLHEHETTTAKFDPKFTAMIRSRNNYFFVWKNITDRRLTALSMVYSPLVALYHRWRDRDPSLWAGWIAALRAWPQVAARRRVEAREGVVSDHEILGRFPISRAGRST